MIYVNGKVFICDTESDVENLPTNRTPGCVAKVASTSNIYILNSSGKWILQTASGSGGSSSEDIHINNAYLDEDENLILEFNTSYKEPLKVNIGSINEPEIFLLQEEIKKNKVQDVSEDFINSLFNN